jgi:RNA polymerase sigma factor (sigma-70 family)
VEPWQHKLAEGDAQGAWDLFVERYRRLILATIRRLISDHDDVMDVFASVCQALAANDCARLKRYTESGSRRASVATWTVVVVRNQTVDWLRHTEGRRGAAIPGHLSPLRQAIYRALCVDHCSPTEAYELIRARTGFALSFAAFLRETRETHAAAPCPKSVGSRHPTVVRLSDDTPASAASEFAPGEASELAARVADALATQPADVRLAVELLVIERVSAADVARVVGWPNAKAVYNRVYRALKALRVAFTRAGIGRGDL